MVINAAPNNPPQMFVNPPTTAMMRKNSEAYSENGDGLMNRM